MPWALAGLLAAGLAVAGGIAWKATRPRPPAPMMKLTSELGLDTTLDVWTTGSRPLSISPDGTRVAVVTRTAEGKRQLAVRLLQQSQVTLLPGTENASSPFFSPDGEWIGFNADGKLKKIPAAGGAPITLCDAPNLRGASWGEDGNIIAALGVSEPLSRVPSAGGSPVAITKFKEGERSHRWPLVLPGGRTALFTASTTVGNYDDTNVDAVSLETGKRKTVQHGGHSPLYLPGGYLVYQHKMALFAMRFDAGRVAVSGMPVSVAEDVPGSAGSFSCAQNGTCVHLTGLSVIGGWAIFWMDSVGKLRPLHGERGAYFTPRLSPDGKRLAFAASGAQGTDIWVRDLERDTASRLSFLPQPQSRLDSGWQGDPFPVAEHAESRAVLDAGGRRRRGQTADERR
jgi:serine/threonine-protein kinase